MKKSILSYLDSRETDMFSLLQQLVLQKSYTLDRDDVNQVGEIIKESLKDTCMTVETIGSKQYGDQLIFRNPACSSSSMQQIMLVGHMDTVFPQDMGFDTYSEDDKNAYGPGVIDMKGGLVTAIFTIKALSNAGLLDKMPLIMLCNSEEENGSPESREIIKEEAKKSLLALVFECGGMKGEYVTGRKGKLGFSISIKGRAGHAAFAGQDKASSILELAHKTIALEKLNDPEKELIVNVGTVNGGIGPNTIAEKAVAQVDCRFLTKEDGKHCSAAVKSIVDKCTINGVSASFEISSSRDVMEASVENKAILKLFKESGLSLQQTIVEEFRSGVSDANTIAGCGIPVLDGLGPIGQFDHSDKEYMIKRSLPDRTRLTAIAILEIYQRKLAGKLF